MLAMPSNIASGSTVELQCGKTYFGTLDLKRKTGVTVKTSGSCGNAVLTPGQPVNGWTLYSGHIYSAPVSFDIEQVLVDKQPVSAAHWPSRSQIWAHATGATASSLTFAMPNADLVGAKLFFKPFEWNVEARTITAYSGGTMTLATTGDPNYDGYALSGAVDFYVEGKLWMLDEPGEWAVSGGRLYVWTTDGLSLEGRVFASPDAHGIDATSSANISIDGVEIFGAADGIHAPNALALHVTNADIEDSSSNGIMNSGGAGLSVDSSTIRNSRHDAIAVKWGGGAEVISNSQIDASGVGIMPVNAHGAINLTSGTGALVTGNHVTNSAYIGIRVFRSAVVAGNVVDGACKTLSDCGGILTEARDGQPLNTRIEGNTIRHVSDGQQKLVWAIDLTDSANGVTVQNNIIDVNENGLMIFNGFNNTITGNSFSNSTQAHIQMGESVSAGSVRGNTVTANVFTSANGEETYRISSDFGDASVAQFGTYGQNTYLNASAVFANFDGQALDFTQWKTKTGQDASSTIAAP